MDGRKLADNTDLPEGFKLDAQPGQEIAQSGAAAPALPPGFQLDSDKYGGFGQQALNVAEHLAKGAFGPLATGAEAALTQGGFPGLSPEEQAGREAAGPIKAGLAEIGGFAGPALLSGGLSAATRAGLEAPEAIGLGVKALNKYGQAGFLEAAGKAAEGLAPALGLAGPGAGILSKIGSSAVRGAVENGLFMAGDEVSKLINGDPNQSVQTALANVGLMGILPGGIIGGGAGAISGLWKKTMAGPTGELLHAMSEHMGGIDGIPVNPVDSLVSRTGMEIAPELQAAASKDPAMREMASVLRQSDTSNSGRTFQKAQKEFTQRAADVLTESIGRTAEQIPSDLDKYSTGKSVGHTLASEVEERVAPIKAGYDEAAKTAAGKDLIPTIEERSEQSGDDLSKAQKELDKATKSAVKVQKSGDPEAAIESAAKVQDAQSKIDTIQQAAKIPGTVDTLQEKIGALAFKEGWTTSPSSEIMKAVNQVQKELPLQKTLKNLTDYIKQVGDQMYDPMNKSLSKAGMQIKAILRDAEGELIAQHIGSEEGPEALERYRETQKAYARESGIKEELEDRLGRLGSTSSYHENIREMSQSDGEGILRKLSGKNDADTIRLLQENFPKTAQAVKEYLLDQILIKAKQGEELSPYRILKGLSELSPQQRGLIIPPESVDRIEAISQFLEQSKDKTHNFSNSARAMSKLMGDVPGAAMGMVAMLMGHNPAAALAIGALTKYVGKEAPDATRLALLKWMGSNKPIEAGAFKSMVDFIHATQKGNTLMDNATKSIFSGSSKVILKDLVPKESDTKNLDNKLKSIQMNPNAIPNAPSGIDHYMPNHAIATTGTAANAAQYVNSLRPVSTKQSPLDPETEPSPEKQYIFQRALQIAQQPLMVTHLLKENQLTSDDVNHLATMFPAFHQRLVQKMTDAMIEHTSKGQTVPYDLRTGISTLTGQPMDSSLSNQAVMSNQSEFSKDSQQNAQNSQVKDKPKSSQVGMRNMKIADRLSLGTPKDNS